MRPVRPRRALERAHGAGLPVDPNVGAAVVAPFAPIGVTWVVRRIRRSHGEGHA
jgi:uncharacterized membrane-anchored protein